MLAWIRILNPNPELSWSPESNSLVVSPCPYVRRRYQEGDAADVRGPLLHPQQQDHPQGHEGRQYPHHQTGTY